MGLGSRFKKSKCTKSQAVKKNCHQNFIGYKAHATVDI